MRVSMLMMAALAMAMTACGGPGVKVGGGKDGAAQALYAASGPTSVGAMKATTPIDLTGSQSWSCPEGGTATLANFHLSVNPGQGGTSVSQTFTLSFSNCGIAKSDAGVAIYNGSFDVAQKVETSTAGAVVEQSFKGRISISGAFDDFLEANITQRVAVSAIGKRSGSVAMQLNGTLATSAGSFSYAEEVNVTGGSIAVDVSRS